MRNDFANAMSLYNMEMNERTFIDLTETTVLSVIPEYGYHYRDADGHMFIAKPDSPQYVTLNCYLMEEGEDGLLDLVDNGDIHFPTEKEFIEYLKENVKLKPE